MKVQKVKEVRHDFCGSGGPSSTTTIGLMYGERTVIFGTYYIGQYMDPGATEDLIAAEQFIDRVVAALAGEKKQ